MLYSAKEKINHLRNLISEDHAHIDVALLKSKQTDIYQIAHWSKFPKKYAREILAALLEIVPAEDIRLNRRSVEDQAIREKEEAERNEKEEEERKAQESEEDHQAKLDEKDDVVDDLTLNIEEKDEEIDELKDQVAELEQQVEDLHEQNLQVPAEKKSSGKRNTRKSTGKK